MVPRPWKRRPNGGAAIHVLQIPRICLIDPRLRREYSSAMFELVLWTGLGAVAGSLVGTYRCSDISRALPKLGHAAHMSICVVVGALAGSMIFLGLAYFLYRVDPFSP